MMRELLVHTAVVWRNISAFPLTSESASLKIASRCHGSWSDILLWAPCAPRWRTKCRLRGEANTDQIIHLLT